MELHQAWPGVTVDAERFAAYVRERAVDVERAPMADLYLACACEAGDPAALAAFESHFMREVGVAAAKLRAAAGIADEARQVVRELLFVGKRAIGSYAGRGDLRGWIRVIAMREVLRLCERTGPAPRGDVAGPGSSAGRGTECLACSAF